MFTLSRPGLPSVIYNRQSQSLRSSKTQLIVHPVGVSQAVHQRPSDHIGQLAAQAGPHRFSQRSAAEAAPAQICQLRHATAQGVQGIQGRVDGGRG